MNPDVLLQRFERAAAERGDAVALVSANGTWSYRVLRAAAERLSARFAEAGLAPGDRIALLCSNRPEFVVALWAALRCGAAVLPINLSYRPREVGLLLEDARPRLVFGDGAALSILDEVGAEETSSVAGWFAAEDLERFVAAPWPVRERTGADSPEGLALLLYTSGTTGRSKGAMTTQANLVAMIDALHAAWEWTAEDALYLTLPLFHTHGLVVGMHCALAAGARVTIEPKFEVERTIAALRRGDHTLFFGVPTLYGRLVEELTARRAAGEDTSFPAVRLFVSGSAPLSAETWTAFRDLTGQEILERYGMTETGMLLSNSLRGRRIPGTVGVPLPGVEARLVASDREGDEGEVQVRGANVFVGYWGAPEKTAEAFVEDASGRRWFRTGDLGRRDPTTAHVTLQGRASELILSGGFNVYPREIEEVILTFPGVREAAVVGEPHADFGQSPVAFLVVDGGLDEAGLGALAEHCRRELAPFKLPRRFVTLEALPRNALGKVEKRKLVTPR